MKYCFVKLYSVKSNIERWNAKIGVNPDLVLYHELHNTSFLFLVSNYFQLLKTKCNDNVTSRLNSINSLFAIEREYKRNNLNLENNQIILMSELTLHTLNSVMLQFHVLMLFLSFHRDSHYKRIDLQTICWFYMVQ